MFQGATRNHRSPACYGWHVPLVGTNANNGAQASPLTFNVNNPASNANVNIGSRAESVYFIQRVVSLPLGKIVRGPLGDGSPWRSLRTWTGTPT